MDVIVKYIDEHRIISIILLIVLLFILYKLWVGRGEHFSSINMMGSAGSSESQELLTEILPIQPTLAEQKAEQDMENLTNNLIGARDKILIRFRYTDPSGARFYMGVSPVSACPNSMCTTNNLVLISEDAVNRQSAEYSKRVDINGKVCNYRATLTNQMDSEMGEEASANSTGCFNTYPQCTMNKQFPTDFIISRVPIGPGVSSNNVFTIQGVNRGINDSDIASPVFVNKVPGQNAVCADAFNSNNNQFTYVDLITTRKQKEGSIIGGLGSNLRTKIRFRVFEVKSDEQIVSTPLYVGKSIDADCGTYKRLTLYPDVIDNNVIEFEPIVFTY